MTLATRTSAAAMANHNLRRPTICRFAELSCVPVAMVLCVTVICAFGCTGAAVLSGTMASTQRLDVSRAPESAWRPPLPVALQNAAKVFGTCGALMVSALAAVPGYAAADLS